MIRRAGGSGGLSAERFLAHAWGLGAAVAPGGPRLAVVAAGEEPPGDAEWIGHLGPGDRLAPGALAVIAAALRGAPGVRALYTDTVVVDAAGSPREILLKPGFDPVLQAALPYAGQLAVLRRDLWQTSGWRGEVPRLDRALAGLPASGILHLPYPACLTAAGPEPRAVTLPQGRLPAISVILPSRDRPELIGTVLDGLMTRTAYPAPEIIVVDNGSIDPRTLALYEAARDRIRVLRRVEPFNFSAMVNRGVAAASGEAFLLLNNDIEMGEPGWLAEMAACLALPGTGVVGARLLYPDGTLQHAGTITGLDGGLAGHWFAGSPADTPGPMGRLRLRGSLSAVTGACMLVSRECWQATGPFDAKRFAVAYNDVDFCLRAGALGFGVVGTPFATLTHHESATRRRRSLPALIAHARECRSLRRLHGTGRGTDPAFSPWLTRETVPRLARLAALPGPRSFRGGFGDA